jgi:hypothetical protein
LLENLGLEKLDGAADAVLSPEEAGTVLLKQRGGAYCGEGAQREVDKELQQ